MSKPPEISDLKRNFSYDPETGDLRWALPRGIRVKAGDEAGSLDDSGFVRVSFNNRILLGHYIAWALHYGEWPAGRLKLKSPTQCSDPVDKRNARSDLRIANIVSADRYLSQDPQTVARREYERRKRADRKHRNHVSMAGVTPVHSDNVWWSDDREIWVVFDMRRADNGAPHLTGGQRELAEFMKLGDADRFAGNFLLNMAYLRRNTFVLDPKDMSRTAGILGARLDDFYGEIAYDPERGKLIWRRGVRMGLDAQTKGTGRSDMVQFKGNKYAAYQVAWFLHTSHWPPRGTIRPKDGDWRNLTADNWEENDL